MSRRDLDVCPRPKRAIAIHGPCKIDVEGSGGDVVLSSTGTSMGKRFAAQRL